MTIGSRLAVAGDHAGVITGSELPQVSIPNTAQFDMRSVHGRTYRIFVAQPSGERPPRGWPVVYHTDGNSSFPIVIAAVEGQSRYDRPAVVVGIGYIEDDPILRRGRRTFDLTPPADHEWLNTKAKPFSNQKTGGCQEFFEFIENELKPEIESRFEIDTNRQTLFGHSFGGLFALHTFLKNPESFQTFVTSSPSLWWNAGSLINEERQFVQRLSTGVETLADRPQGSSHQEHLAHNTRLLVTIGEFELNPPPGHEEEKPPAFREETEIGDASQLVERLQSAGIHNLEVHFQEIPEAHHGSAELPAVSKGMQFALDD